MSRTYAEQDFDNQRRKANALRQAGEETAARAIYRAIWDDALDVGDDRHACIAAHLLGLSEPMPLDEKRRWHLESLQRARMAREGWATLFFASIYVNLDYIAMQQRRLAKAIRYYDRANRAALVLAGDTYGRSLRSQIAWALDQLRELNEQALSPEE